MSRVFASLAAANLILFLCSAVLGFFAPADSPDRHVLLAVLSLLLACAVQVLSFTYLTVTFKVLTQAVHLGKLQPEMLEPAKDIRRRFSRSIGFLLVLIVAVVATGAAAWRSGSARLFHLPAVSIFLVGWVFTHAREWTLISRNAALLDQTLTRYAVETKQTPV